ncbi:MAG: hypothetical protein LBE13_21240 [Bacteroidales bacterium]|nr:hypothetical protein [Bacteroidales bacterium]
MAQNKKASASTACPTNFDCTGDKVGGSITPAASGGCISDAAVNSVKDSGITAGSPIKRSQVLKLHEDIVAETRRQRANPQYQSIGGSLGDQINWDDTMSRIKQNLKKLTGQDIPVEQGSLIEASDIDEAYRLLNIAQSTCVCDNRCTCNARGPDCTTVINCNNNESAYAGGPACECDTVMYCSCDNRCHCNNQCSCDERNGCWGNCDCNGRTGTPLPDYGQTTTCKTRCACNIRETVECACNIRTPCVQFV